MIEKFKYVADWVTANADVIMNYAVSVSAVVLLASKLIFKTKQTLSSIKKDEIIAETDTQMKRFQSALEIKQNKIMDEYMKKFNAKMDETSAMLKTRQDELERQRQAEIEKQTIKVNEKIELLKKIKSTEEKENESSAV